VILTVALVFGTITLQQKHCGRSENSSRGEFTLKRITITLLTLILLAPSTAFSQTRNRSSSRQKPPATTAAQRVAQVRTQGATRVADQIKNLTKFMYILGGVTSSIAAVEDAARRSGASPADQTAQSRAQVKATIQNIRE